MAEPLFKVTYPDGSPCNGGQGRWPVPRQDRRRRSGYRPGTWRWVDGEIVPCRNGLHLVRAHQVALWLQQECTLWLAEVAPDAARVEHRDKLVVSGARLVRPLCEYNAVRKAELEVVWGRDTAAWVRSLLMDDRRPLVFGVHRMPAKAAEHAPAWPSLAMIRGNANRRYTRFIQTGHKGTGKLDAMAQVLG